MPNSYKLPIKELLIKQLYGSKRYSKFDCKSGYWQIKLDEASKPLISFTTSNPLRLFEWNVMSFGLMNAPTIFQQRMDKIIRSIKDLCIIYIDDILIHSKNLEEHIEHFKRFNYIARKYRLALSERKAKIAKTEIEFLRCILTKEKILQQPHIRRKIIEFPEVTRDKKELQSFIGLLNYSEKFIKNCAKIQITIY